ncbi:hypothetical protein BDR05DRAFT_1004609 [Suillus weaverae]|nr:hypothetical protein BDR05DRAFT_1004609 [Suillus weaverae]
MQWIHYFRNIVQRYQVIIVGWPDNIPFVNLSKVSSSLSELERLFNMWDTHITCWKTLSDEEFAKLYEERNEELKSGQIEDIRRRTRSDKGKKRKRPAATNNKDKNTARKKYKSVETIDNNDKENDEDNHRGQTTPPPSPRQPSNATPGASSFCQPSETTPNPTFEPSGATLNFGPSITNPNLTFEPPVFTPNPTFESSSGSLDSNNHNNGPFNFDAALARLDQIYGPSGSTQSSSAHVDESSFDFTNINNLYFGLRTLLYFQIFNI